MREIEITQRVRTLIRQNARGSSFQDTSRPALNGNWIIEVDEEVLEYLNFAAFPGETHSDTIERLFAIRAGVN